MYIVLQWIPSLNANTLR